MGTINYFVSELITLATVPDLYSDFEEEAAQEAAETGRNIDDIIYQWMEDNQDADIENAEDILEKYNFQFFRISVQSGYYAGVQIMIDLDGYPDELDNGERAAIMDELDKLESALIDLAGVGYVETMPGWCTSYSDYPETVKAIRQTIDAERETVKAIPAWTPENWTA